MNQSSVKPLEEIRSLVIEFSDFIAKIIRYLSTANQTLENNKIFIKSVTNAIEKCRNECLSQVDEKKVKF